MATDTLRARVQALEQTVNGETGVSARLDGLGAGVRRLGHEVETLSSRIDTLTGKVETLSSRIDTLTGTVETLSGRVDTLTGTVETLGGRVETLRGEVGDVRREVVVGDEETRRFMRVLHEDMIARIATLRG